MLIMVMGLPGSGKTFFAKALAQRVGGEHFNSDKIRKQQEQHPAYSARKKSQVYQIMFNKVCQALVERNVVVVDATFSLQQYRDPYVNFIQKHQIPLKIMLVTADEKTIFQRLQHSRPDSDADFEVYKKIKSEFEPLSLEHLTLDSGQLSLEDMITLGLKFIGNYPGHD